MFPANLILQACIFELTLWSDPKTSLLERCSLQSTLRAIRSILLLYPSILFFKDSVIAHISVPYRRIDSTVAWNRRIFKSRRDILKMANSNCINMYLYSTYVLNKRYHSYTFQYWELFVIRIPPCMVNASFERSPFLTISSMYVLAWCNFSLS